ncbi:4'-phosphopantetheinyl transferase family protein [Peterkaempfera bronchialis]|uniref:4'-phosphopantetheinyl transferase n=1 Tax=Peterkaempfera bronchialis TaxID=2126346 RepID=A0A345SUE1_9ACTN|nr:4'-phosphopantetheinyl transferase superfamily protein [Peterkaempfera bronchialis]AXI77346.1 4'-phosphopantetheinyl transferase [Peterkaempfera bronchialis]
MIETIVGPSVVSADTYEDVPDAPLFPEERAAVARAVDKRRLEYTTARVCARRALSQLGLPPSPIPSGPRGEPLWPPGVVGSITHCEGYRGAVVGRSAEIATLGIDAEPHLPLPDGVLEAISLPDERTRLRELTASVPEVAWDRLLFSAKESVYKAWFPLAKRWLDFDDALITADPGSGTFSARLLVPGPVAQAAGVTGFSGRWLVRDGLVLTAIVVPADEVCAAPERAA